ncbi:DUF397 domain-containing protein [Streptomyces sp. NPDC057217]|uniref:DUF397 domain-containing protein n=1 Tax=Streptomyces sp. NPDC057217 TaxID=3346054 RepID=UPI00362A2525
MTLSTTSVRALTWTKSSYSEGATNCVEVARDQLPGVMPVRDSKNPAGPALIVPADAWSAFVGGVKDGAL